MVPLRLNLEDGLDRVRMNGIRWALMVLPLFLPACEKAKDAVGKLREGAGGLVERVKSDGVDEGLAALVAREEGGVRFRRDLPFPSDLTVESTSVWAYGNGRGLSRSESGGREAFALSGTFERVVRFGKKGGEVVMTLDRSGPVVTKEKDGKEPKPLVAPEHQDPESRLVGKSLTLHHTREGWRMPKSRGAVDFQLMTWGRTVEAQAGELFESASLFPRSQWFPSARVWKEGESLELEGPALALLADRNSSGKVRMVFEAEEAVGGHPCARFGIQGDLSTTRPGIDGRSVSLVMTITAGKVWCSLLHPVILKEEADVVATIDSEGAGRKVRYQGSLQISETKTWKGP